ncbi:hypothetical protein ACE15N_22185 (plasmid) [Xanthomonas campestris pv. passiflorae]|jgi:hypothetical protein
MQLSIRDASRFLVGAALMRSKAIEASGNPGISFDYVASAALRTDADGERLRLSINTLADQEAGAFRNTPPHTLTTDRVMQSRDAEVRTWRAIGLAGIETIEHSGDLDAAGPRLQSSYMDALKAIDETPGSTQERRQLHAVLQDEIAAAATEPGKAVDLLRKSERSYLDAERDAILARYEGKLTHSDDYDAGM